MGGIVGGLEMYQGWGRTPQKYQGNCLVIYILGADGGIICICLSPCFSILLEASVSALGEPLGGLCWDLWGNLWGNLWRNLWGTSSWFSVCWVDPAWDLGAECKLLRCVFLWF